MPTGNAACQGRLHARNVILVAVETDHDDLLDVLKAHFPTLKIASLPETMGSTEAVRLSGWSDNRGAPAPYLTSRQAEILTGLLQGWSNKEIARNLGLSHFTVRNHLAALFKVFGVKSRRELQAKLIRSNLCHWR